MKILLAVDRSKYGRWATEWVAQLPIASPPHVTAIHVVDAVALRAPFMVQPLVVGNKRFIREEIKQGWKALKEKLSPPRPSPIA